MESASCRARALQSGESPAAKRKPPQDEQKYEKPLSVILAF